MNSWAITDRGIVRQQNQDAYFVYCDNEKNRALLLVCDGMGGAKAGNIASILAAESFSAHVKQRLLLDDPSTPTDEVLREAAQYANTAVYEKSLSSSDYAGMGTTLVAAYVTDDSSVILNAGDSRAYHVSKYGIRQITRDHSVVEDMIASGDLTREESINHPNKNLITRAFGTGPNIVCDVFYTDMKEGERLLLCSDGLTNYVSDQELFSEISGENELNVCCENLLQLVMSRGAPDNVTLVLFER